MNERKKPMSFNLTEIAAIAEGACRTFSDPNFSRGQQYDNTATAQPTTPKLGL